MVRRFLCLVSALLLLLPGACGKADVTTSVENTTESGGEEGGSSAKVLVVYFSFTGVTEGYAKSIAEISEGDLWQIVPEIAYTDADKQYYDKSSRAYQEQNDRPNDRPAIKGTLENAGGYDIIFLGHPIWYSKAPRVMFTFLDKYGFKGKKVIEFVTSQSTGITAAETELKNTYKDITWSGGRKLNGSGALSEKELEDWVKSGIK